MKREYQQGKDHPSRNRVQRIAVSCMLSCMALLYAGKSAAKPDMKPLGPNIADRGSAVYHFSVHQFDSADGKRHYRVWTGVPDTSPPPSGYPVLYMLDGNALMDRLSDELLKQLTQKTPPVIVAIGYQTPLPFDTRARAYDYTPAVQQGAGAVAVGHYTREGGGSATFRRLLEGRIAPTVEKNINIDPNKRGLWGHSFGGLFVLDSWLSSSFFHFYYAASPSLGRDNFALLTRMESLTKQEACHKQLYLLEGDDPSGSSAAAGAAGVLSRVRNTVSLLKEEGLAATYWHYPGLTHGPMFNASFRSALLHIGTAGESGVQRCEHR
ncbi:hypothetical protein WP3W18E01_16880 [Raoultella ornithinolytica]|nr:hypothetical protein WP3W18E01_16880 [Raoultella ornithinolytica]